jgi:hypothetical protein
MESGRHSSTVIPFQPKFEGGQRMEILVNQEPIDFQLEDESSLGDVMDGLLEWLRAGQFTVTTVDVDDHEMIIAERSQWQDRNLHDVDRISVQAMPVSELESATIATLSQYMRLLQERLDSGDQTTVSDLLQEMPSVAPRLTRLFPELAVGDPATQALFTAREAPDPNTQSHQLITRAASRLSVLLTGRLREHLDSDQEMATTLGRLVRLAEELRDVPVALQTGDEKRAMDTVIRLTELVSKALRLLPHASSAVFDLESLRRTLAQTAPHLRELEEAFHAKDSVLIGDLLEYELAPLLEGLGTVVFDDTGNER